MSRIAILKIRSGDFNCGFDVSLQILRQGGSLLAEIEGRLPPQPNLDGFYVSWRTRFRSLNSSYRRSRRFQTAEDGWEIDESTPTNRAIGNEIEACKQLTKTLEREMKNWLQDSALGQWQKIRERLLREFANRSDPIDLTIDARDPKLWKLPWHVWDLLEDYPDVGISYTFPEFDRPSQVLVANKKENKVRILAIFGDDSELDLEVDRQLISGLKEASVEFLNAPRSRTVIERLRDPQGWDVFFFAGHSHSEEDDGRIYLNESENLEIDEFKNALKEAIARGLKIAIFNSCDGLGFTRKLADLHLPVAIVMQEEVPDRVAQSFLKEFLAEYATGTSLVRAVRRSQERLEAFRELPGCTWLPALYQNLGATLPTWETLRDRSPRDRPAIAKQLRRVALTSLAIGLSAIASRHFGALQSLELASFDLLMRNRAIEAPDDRLAIVAITEEDLQFQDRMGWRREAKSLSDLALYKLLEKLQTYRPRVIALDLYRDFPTDPNIPELKQHFNRPNFIGTCLVGGTRDRPIGIAPPPEIESTGRLGFSNFPQDANGVIRRQILGMSPDRTCPTSQSLSLTVALAYLRSENIINIGFNSNNELKIGSVIFPKLTAETGGYQLPRSEAQGYQVLLNYRAAEAIAPQVSLQEVLEGTVDDRLPELVTDKIVLIGTIAQTYQDWHLTPYSKGQWPQKMPGAIVHAHGISQIVSAVIDKRPLINTWPDEIEMLWILTWCFLGGILILLVVEIYPLSTKERWNSFRIIAIGFLSTAGAIAVLSSLSFFLFELGFWVPIVPASLGLLLTSGGIIVSYVCFGNKG